jgi:hypothetical protein
MTSIFVWPSRLLAVAVLLSAATELTFAQSPGVATVGDTSGTDQSPQLGLENSENSMPIEQMENGLKSGSTALTLSLLASAVPGAVGLSAQSEGADNAGSGLLLLGALIVGPSVGHFYADRPGRAFAGIGIRAAAAAGLGAAVAMSWNKTSEPAKLLAGASIAVGGGSILWDILSAPRSVRLHNEKSRPRLSVTPTGIGKAGGVQMTVRF